MFIHNGFIVILIFLFLFENVPIYAGNHFRIFGGSETSIEKHPWMVSLQHSSLGHFCGGSLINYDTILTAAHCIIGDSASFHLVAGTSRLVDKGFTLKIKNITVHEKWTMSPNLKNKYDIAIIKLAEKVKFSKRVKTILLPDQDIKVPVGTALVVAGWGDIGSHGPQSDVLKEATVSVMESDSERLIYAWDKKSGVCSTDSGGPLELNGTLVGIVSFGPAKCEENSQPAGYTNVAFFRGWIKETLEYYE
ncbi:trypsin theta-like isoform X1 [Diabrotica virgifera virgifera]|uniref:Peptidase S1 domain-containing protein n=1 Tax=Diabrotica virgifera virgifera TaxID=50390 RepID=A0ABM5JIV5_DIAVI|nr:trypsin theta-like isoform X1 [Diabrotica virgifera virgifera]